MVEGYSTDNYTDWAIDFIEQRKQVGGNHGTCGFAMEQSMDRSLPLTVIWNATRTLMFQCQRMCILLSAGKPAYVARWNFGNVGQRASLLRDVRDTSPVGMKDQPGRQLSDWVRQYHQGVLAIDENVGRLMKSLRATGCSKIHW